MTPIKPDVQLKIGTKLIQKIKDDFKGRYIKLYAIPSSVSFYEKSGFKKKTGLCIFIHIKDFIYI